MKKFYCDICGKEISSEEAHGRPVFTLGLLEASVMRAVDEVWNAGEVCLECIRDCVEGGEVRWGVQ